MDLGSSLIDVCQSGLQSVLGPVQHTFGLASVRIGTSLVGIGHFLVGHSWWQVVEGAVLAIYGEVMAYYDALDDVEKMLAFAWISIFNFAAFLFIMPRIAPLFLRAEFILSPVPMPSKTVPREDRQSEFFSRLDNMPLLVDPNTYTKGPVLEAINPATGKSLGHVRVDTPEVIDLKLSAARKAQPAWAATSAYDRLVLMRVLKAYIVCEQQELCEISCADTGKTMLDASLGEIMTTLEKLRWILKEGVAALSPERRSVGPASWHKAATVEFDPLGVIGAIAPWNYPLHNLFNPAIAALFAGNAIVVKPSEHTAYSSLYFARILRRALSLCGHSPEVVQVLVGGPEVGMALVNSDIDKLFFTGSTAVGRQIAETAAKRLLPVVLELGGKDPLIICGDANIDQAVNICLRGVFQNSGQNCIGVERVFVHTTVKSKVLERIVKTVKAMRLGVDVGAMTLCATALTKLQELVDDAVSKGATVLVGGKAGKGEGIYAGGYFFEPTVLDGVHSEMRIAREEAFGPILCIYGWTSDLEVIAKANDCEFGLGASVFTSSRRRAKKIMGGLRVGMVNRNDFGMTYMCQSLPFGGTKQSGIGHFGGVEGLRACCLMKSITRDRFPFIRTRLPRNLKYPVSDNAYEFSAEVNELLYDVYGLSRIDNTRNLLTMSLLPKWRPRSIGNR